MLPNCTGSPVASPLPAPEIPYVKPTLKAILKDAILPSSFWEFLKLAIPGGIMMQVLTTPPECPCNIKSNPTQTEV